MNCMRCIASAKQVRVLELALSRCSVLAKSPNISPLPRRTSELYFLFMILFMMYIYKKYSNPHMVSYNDLILRDFFLKNIVTIYDRTLWILIHQVLKKSNQCFCFCLVFLAHISQFGNNSTSQTFYGLNRYLQLVPLFILFLFCLQHACLLIDQVDHCSTVFFWLHATVNWHQWLTVTADLVAHRSYTEVGAAQTTAAGTVSCLTRMIGGQLPGKQLLKPLIPATFFLIPSILFCHGFNPTVEFFVLVASFYALFSSFSSRTFTIHLPASVFVSPQLHPQWELFLPLAFCERATHSVSPVPSLETHCKCLHIYYLSVTLIFLKKTCHEQNAP